MVSEAEEVVIGFGSGRIFVVMAGYVLAMLRNLVVMIETRVEAVMVTEANLGPGNHLVPGVAEARMEAVVVMEVNLRPGNYTAP